MHVLIETKIGQDGATLPVRIGLGIGTNWLLVGYSDQADWMRGRVSKGVPGGQDSSHETGDFRNTDRYRAGVIPVNRLNVLEKWL